MTVTVGTASFYHTRLPHQSKLEKMARNMDLSKEARVRLSWLTHYKRQGNASVTARRFGISRSTLHKWVKRYAERGPRGLVDEERTLAWAYIDDFTVDYALTTIINGAA